MAVHKLKTIGDRLFDDAMLRYQAAARGEDVDFSSIKGDAERLARVNRAEACVVYLIIAAHEWDLDAANYWAEQEVLLSPTAQSNTNAMKTYLELNRPDLALPYAKKAFELAGASAEFVSYVAVVLSLGHISEHFKMIENADAAMRLDLSPKDSGMLQVIAAIEKKALTDERIAKDFRAAFDIATEHRIHIREIKHRITYNVSAAEPTYAPQFLFWGDLATEMVLEDALAERLCQDESWDPLSFNVEFAHEKR